MNAPAKTPPARDRYKPMVRHCLPQCTGDELELRASLLLARDQATSKLRSCSDEARPILQHIIWLVTNHGYSSMPPQGVQELRRQVTRLISCAAGLEMFAYRLAYPEREANAGG